MIDRRPAPAHCVYQAAVVGCGRIGSRFAGDPRWRGVWTHAAAYRQNRRTRLVALADIDGRARAAAARQWGVARTYPTLTELLQAHRIDIVSVCTPSDSHAALVREALAAGVSAVWCEKPVTHDLTEARALVRDCEGRIVAVNHVRRWDAAYEAARRWLEAGRAGKLLAATAWYTDGVRNIGSHLFDTLRFLLGDAEWVWAAPDAAGAADPTLSGVIGFGQGLLCHVVGCGSGTLYFEVDLVGTDGRLRVSGNGARVETWAVRQSRHYPRREPGAPRLIWKGGPARDRLVRALNDIVRCLDGGGAPRCTALDGLKALEIVTAFVESAATGRRIDLPLPDGVSRRPSRFARERS